MGFHINLCLSALYNKETKQYEITKEQLWESFKAQMENEDNISHKVLYCNSCGTVSYTHLDVYKRQNLLKLILLEHLIFFMLHSVLYALFWTIVRYYFVEELQV